MALTAVGKVMREHADRANKIVANGTWVDDTPMGLFYYLIEDYKRAVEEDAAWDEKSRRDADEASEDAYDEYMRDTQEGERPLTFADFYMI